MFVLFDTKGEDFGSTFGFGKAPVVELFFVTWHVIVLFAETPARRGLGHTVTPVFGYELESPCWFLVATPLCVFCFSGLQAKNDKSLTSRLRRLTTLAFTVLAIGVFIRTVCFGVVRG